MRKKTILIMVAVFVAGYLSAPVLIPGIPAAFSFLNDPALTVQQSLKSEADTIKEFEDIQSVILFKNRYGDEVSVNPTNSMPQISVVHYSAKLDGSESKVGLFVAKYPDGSTVSEFFCMNYEKNLQYNIHQGEVEEYLENFDCFEYDGPITWKDANSFYGFTYPKP